MYRFFDIGGSMCFEVYAYWNSGFAFVWMDSMALKHRVSRFLEKALSEWKVTYIRTN